MKDTDFFKYIDNAANTLNSIKEYSNTISVMIHGLNECLKVDEKCL